MEEEVFWGKIDLEYEVLTMLTLVHIKRQIQALERSRDVIASNWWKTLLQKYNVFRIQTRRIFSGVVVVLGQCTTPDTKRLEINRVLRYRLQNCF